MTLFKKNLAFCTIILFLLACGVNKTNTAAKNIEEKDQEANWIKAVGKVSHMYTSNGCGPVIINVRKSEKDTLILIPVSSINEFDIDNLKIKFTYRILKIHSKKGCGPGIPIQIKIIEKK